MPMLNREWRPRGAGLVAAEVVYTVTDPPIRTLRRFIPPLRVGAIAIDFAFALTMLLCFVLLGITGSLARA
jgi:YggT family protein